MANLQTIVEKVSATLEITKKDAEAAIRTALDAIVATAIEEGSVKLAGFGTVVVKETAARTGKSIQTGETIQIPASKKIGVKFSSTVKTAVKESV